jgi:hypothetical protein
MSLWKALRAALALLDSGSATVYGRPTDDGPHANVKYRRVYDQADPQSLREILTIDDHVAYEATIHAALVQTPRIDEVRVRAEPATFRSSVAFFHLAERGRGAIEVPDAVCSRSVHFLPANDASYLLELSFKDDACSLSCLEQVPGPHGELENRACPAAPPPPPRALPATHFEIH